MDPNLGSGTDAGTGQQGPVLYKDEKGVNVAAHPPEGGPVEASSLP